jgi:hypothetical protein
MSIKLDDLNGPLEKLSDGPTDGRYFAKVVRADVCRSKQGNRQVRWDIELETPDDDSGYPLRKYHPIEAQYLRFLVNDLDKFNVRLTNMCDLPRTLKYLTGAKVEVDVHEDGEYYVVSFLRLVSTRD